MEHWQFLIQKQGDRSWHALESPNIEILEGEYRVLARSNLPNTDVEVRVTHSSTQEVPPHRRIFKRSRRTNSEGLMAVIPFTYLNPGVWELRCSGDLMSDLLGKSWHYRVQLQVLSQEIERETGRGGTQGPYISVGAASAREAGQSPIDIRGERENVESNFAHHSIIPLPPNPATLPEAGLHTSTLEPLNPHYLDTTASAETTITPDNAIVTELAITNSNPTSTTLPDEAKEAETVIDQPVSPVWLKGETAEQILQNLIELALPASEVLLEDETVTDSPATQPPPPLLLTLDQEIYIACWGQALTINGQIELKEKTNLDLAETLFPKSLCALELRIELRSPSKSEILTQVRQPLPDQALPFTISTSIDIPAECESKLILADISLYGGLADVGEVIQLARQSFTITADLVELLAITAVAKPSTPDVLKDPNASTSPDAFTEPETSISLDLELFNLVKTPKTDQSQIFIPSPNKRLPPRINLRVLREASLRASMLKDSANEHSPQLPKLPPSQTTAIALTDVITELSIQEETVNKDATIAAINLEQLVIRHRRLPMLNSTFPYLRRLKALPDNREEVKSNAPDPLEFQVAKDFPQLDTTVTKDKNTPELATGNIQLEDDSVAVPEVSAPSNAEFIDKSVVEVVPPSSAELIAPGNPDSSPLIKKWMQSQGYSLPESIDVQYQDDDTYAPAQHTPLPPNAETSTVDVHLSLSLDTETKTKADMDVIEVEEIETQEQDERVFGVAGSETDEMWLATIETSPVADATHSLLPPWSTGIDLDGESLLTQVSQGDRLTQEDAKGDGGFHTTSFKSAPLPHEQLTNPEEATPVFSSLQEAAPTRHSANIAIAKDDEGHLKAGTSEDTGTEEHENTESSLPTSPRPLLQLSPSASIKTPSAWLAQEIVIDDTYSELSADATRSYPSEQEAQPLSNVSRSLPTAAVIIEPLPIPQLYVPEGELIIGKSVRVRVEMPDVPPQVVVKLWVEDCQTRWLLDGPHLLTNLLPNSLGGLEVMTLLNIPFGCLEIRLEAIALDMVTQQESHKVTIVRTVIPPDLPTLQLDELLGM